MANWTHQFIITFFVTQQEEFHDEMPLKKERHFVIFGHLCALVMVYCLKFGKCLYPWTMTCQKLFFKQVPTTSIWSAFYVTWICVQQWTQTMFCSTDILWCSIRKSLLNTVNMMIATPSNLSASKLQSKIMRSPPLKQLQRKLASPQQLSVIIHHQRWDWGTCLINIWSR